MHFFKYPLQVYPKSWGRTYIYPLKKLKTVKKLITLSEILTVNVTFLKHFVSNL